MSKNLFFYLSVLSLPCFGSELRKALRKSKQGLKKSSDIPVRVALGVDHRITERSATNYKMIWIKQSARDRVRLSYLVF